MKLDPILMKQLEWRFSKDQRKILLVNRCKMFIHLNEDEWQQNCTGLLVFSEKNKIYYLTIINISNFQINFDFQLYTNFTLYSKFIGEQKCLIFLAPTKQLCLKIMFVLESRQQLVLLKKQIDQVYKNTVQDNNEQQFFQKAQVMNLLAKAQIDEKIRKQDPLFQKQLKTQLMNFFGKVKGKENSMNKVGFKSYAIGKLQLKIQDDQKQFINQKNQQQTITNLMQLQKQAKTRFIQKQYEKSYD